MMMMSIQWSFNGTWMAMAASQLFWELFMVLLFVATVLYAILNCPRKQMRLCAKHTRFSAPYHSLSCTSLPDWLVLISSPTILFPFSFFNASSPLLFNAFPSFPAHYHRTPPSIRFNPSFLDPFSAPQFAQICPPDCFSSSLLLPAIVLLFWVLSLLLKQPFSQ